MWKPEEIEYLTEKWGEQSITSIARNLNKTVKQIQYKAKSLELGKMLEATDYITVNCLMQTLGISSSRTIIDKYWIQKRGMPVKRKLIIKRRVRVIHIADFWKWAEKNKHFINFKNLEENMLGAEPAWVKQKRREDRKNVNKQVRWTEADDTKLIYLLNSNRYTYSELSDNLNRTTLAIFKRMKELGLKQKAMPPERKKWGVGDLTLLNQYVSEGRSYESMAELLQRSTSAIRSKVFRIYGSENLDSIQPLAGM